MRSRSSALSESLRSSPPARVRNSSSEGTRSHARYRHGRTPAPGGWLRPIPRSIPGICRILSARVHGGRALQPRSNSAMSQGRMLAWGPVSAWEPMLLRALRPVWAAAHSPLVEPAVFEGPAGEIRVSPPADSPIQVARLGLGPPHWLRWAPQGPVVVAAGKAWPPLY
jgi:hypothetical protein